MSGIHIFNMLSETHKKDECVYPCYEPYIFSNPYKFQGEKNVAKKFRVKTLEEAVDQYSHYYDVMYGSNLQFTDGMNMLYEDYKSGKDVYLGCYEPLEMNHCNIIKQKMENRLIKEKIHGKNSI